jgi:hypothetical protein
MKKHLLFLMITLSQIAFTQECLNVNYKLRGYFHAGTSEADSTALGGFYEDTNRPKKLTSEIAGYATSKELEIFVKTDSVTEFKKGVSGFKVFVINKSDATQKLPAQDSRLYIVRQVFYKNEWTDIEYLPSSWCGNSYHNVFIKPNEYWDFTAPCLQGKITAKFRFQLYVDEKLTLYSNEFDGSFNKGQLKKEQGYKAAGIMDPYDN